MSEVSVKVSETIVDVPPPAESVASLPLVLISYAVEVPVFSSSLQCPIGGVQVDPCPGGQYSFSADQVAVPVESVDVAPSCCPALWLYKTFTLSADSADLKTLISSRSPKNSSVPSVPFVSPR